MYAALLTERLAGTKQQITTRRQVVMKFEPRMALCGTTLFP